jgi:hypothetical protein
MWVMVLFLLAGAVPVQDGAQTVVFRTPAFFGLVGVMSAAMIIACFRNRSPSRQAFFVLTHLGAVAVIAGAAMGFFLGQRSEFTIPVDRDWSTGVLPGQGDESLHLGFTLSAESLRVDYYDPSYVLFRKCAGPDGSETFKKERVLAARWKTVDLGAAGKLDLSTLVEDGRWPEEKTLADGSVIRRLPAMPRRFEADLRFRRDRVDHRVTLEVNKPAVFRDWRFYLVKCRDQGARSVTLMARQDPGRRLVITGLWMLMAGAFGLCVFLRSEEVNPR